MQVAPRLQVRVGCEFAYDVAAPSPALVQVAPRADGNCRVLEETWERSSDTPMETCVDLYGNPVVFEVVPSAANFVFAKHPAYDAGRLAAALREKEIFVRHFKLPRIEQYLRVSIGTDVECNALLDALRDTLSS